MKIIPMFSNSLPDMWETMHHANGCGLAAPQIGHAIRLFVVDSKTTFERFTQQEKLTHFDKGDSGIAQTFINAKIIHRSDEVWVDEEGCLSIPGLLYKVKRNWSISIEYVNKDFEQQIKTFSGITARMIQHEYDHTEGILYLDHLKPLSRKLMEPKLRKIMKGQVYVTYPMQFM